MRPASERSLGQIPWSAIKEYAQDACLQVLAARIFKRVIREMDSSYLDWHKSEFERTTQQQRNAAKAKQSTAKVRRGPKYSR